MPLDPIVTRTDVDERYPGAPNDFVPTHRVQVRDPRTNDTMRWDLVRLAESNGQLAYACDPFGEDLYGVLSTGLWQCLVLHGRIKVTPVRYKAEYVPPKSRDGVVYFVEAGSGGPVKIGWTQDIERRIAELQTANAHKLNLLGTVAGTMENEAAVHAHFSHLRMEAEWFNNSSEIHEFIKKGTVNSLYEGPSR